MSKQQAELASAEVLGQLTDLSKQAVSEDRQIQAWRLVQSVADNRDFPMVLDFALEHGLVQSCEEMASGTPAARQTMTWMNPIDGSEMVWIPPGPFYVGRRRTLAECGGFSLARHPVTNEQFRRFIKATGYAPPDEHPEAELFLSHWENGKIPKGLKHHPVVWVSLVDALHYCRWAEMTLPTEWLWEKAARGPDGRLFPWGDEWPRFSQAIEDWKKLVHVAATSTCAVGQFGRVRSPYGCEDMIGNVSEWCQPMKKLEYGAMPARVPGMAAFLDGSIEFAPVRGSCFLRMSPQRMVASHERELSVCRRNQWVGFRPAFLAAWRPRV